MTKVTKEQLLYILRKHKEGVKQRSIAKAIGVKPCLVNYHIRRRGLSKTYTKWTKAQDEYLAKNYVRKAKYSDTLPELLPYHSSGEICMHIIKLKRKGVII